MDLGEAKSKFADVAVKAVTYNGQTYGVPYAVESVALVRNNALTKDEPKTYDDMIASGKTAGVEYPFIIQMGDKGDPYHFYGFQTSFGAPVFNTNADGEYTSELAMGGSGGTDFANWLKAQGARGRDLPVHHRRHRQAEVPRRCCRLHGDRSLERCRLP